jgi:hypothetical protein
MGGMFLMPILAVLAMQDPSHHPVASVDPIERDDVVWRDILQHTAVERLLSHERVNADIWLRVRPRDGSASELIYFKREPRSIRPRGDRRSDTWVARRISFTITDIDKAIAEADRAGLEVMAGPSTPDSAGVWPGRFEVAGRVHARYEVAWPEHCPAIEAQLATVNQLLAQRLAIPDLPGGFKGKAPIEDGAEITLGARGVLAGTSAPGRLEVRTDAAGPIGAWSSATEKALEPCWRPDAERPFL